MSNIDLHPPPTILVLLHVHMCKETFSQEFKNGNLNSNDCKDHELLDARVVNKTKTIFSINKLQVIPNLG